MPEERTPQTWTYIGRRVESRATGELRHWWVDEQGKYHSFAKPITNPPAQPGSQWTVWADATSVATGGKQAPVFLGMADDQPTEVLEWQAEDRAAETYRRMVRQAKADMSYDALADLLAPLRERYWNTNGTGRAALLGAVIEAITYGPRKGR